MNTEADNALRTLCATAGYRGDLPVIERGTPEWEAWRAWRIEYGLPVALMDSRGRWTVPSEYPPVDLYGSADDARARLGRGRGAAKQRRVLEDA